jgi:hypothetical protein
MTSTAVRIVILGLFLLSAYTRPLAAQEMPSAAALVACFEARHTPGGNVKECPTAATLEGVVGSPSRYATETVDGVLTGLTRLAISSRSEGARVAAAIWLRVPGDKQRPPADRLPGIVARMREVYLHSADGNVKRAVADYLRHQVEVDQAVELLRQIAQEDRPEERRRHEEPLAYHAIQTLANMGEPGRVALKRLYEEGRVTSPRGLARLRFLADHGFQERPGS